jgi:ADP-ribose pyrophosphatase YjhB (NUDIX family)/transposase
MTNDFEQGDCCPIENESQEKSLSFGSRSIRPGSIDAFTDKEVARQRARQLGCIGIRQYNSTTGGFVWMPCTNESDYRRVTGQSPLGRRNQDRDFAQRVRRVINKKTIEEKALGPNVGQAIGVTPRNMDPTTAVDADKDRLVLEGIAEINFGRGIPDPTPGGNQVEGAVEAATTNFENIVKPQPRITPALPEVDIDEMPKPRMSPTERPRAPREPNKLRPKPDAAEGKPTGPVGAISFGHKPVGERKYGSYASKVPEEFDLPEESILRNKILDIMYGEERFNDSSYYVEEIKKTTKKANEAGLAKLKSIISQEGLASQLFDEETAKAATEWWDTEFEEIASLFLQKLRSSDLEEIDFDAALNEYQKIASISIGDGQNARLRVLDGMYPNYGSYGLPSDVGFDDSVAMVNFLKSGDSLASFGSRAIFESMQVATIEDYFPSYMIFGEKPTETMNDLVRHQMFRSLFGFAEKIRELSDEQAGTQLDKSLLGAVFNAFAMSMFMRGGFPTANEGSDTYTPKFAENADSSFVIFRFAELADALDTVLVDHKEALSRARSKVISSNKEIAVEKIQERLSQETDSNLPINNFEFVRSIDSRDNVKIASRLAVLSKLSDEELIGFAQRLSKRGLFRRNNQANSFIDEMQPLSLDGAFQTAERVTGLSSGKINLLDLAGALYTPDFFDGWMNRDGISQTWESYLKFGKSSRTYNALKKMTPEQRARFLGLDEDMAEMLVNSAQEDMSRWTDNETIASRDLLDTLQELGMGDSEDLKLTLPPSFMHPSYPLQYGNSIVKALSHPIEQFVSSLNLRDMQLEEIWNNSHTNARKLAIDGLVGDSQETAKDTAFKIASYLFPDTWLSEISEREASPRYPNEVPTVELRRQLNRYDQPGSSFIDFAIMADKQDNSKRNTVLERNEHLINALGIIGTAIRTLGAYGDEVDTIATNVKQINNSVASEILEENGESFSEMVDEYMDGAPFAWGPSGAMANRSGFQYSREKRKSGSWSPLANYAQSSMYLDYRNKKNRKNLDIANSIDASQQEVFGEISELMLTLRERVANNTLKLADYAKSYDQKTGTLSLDFYNPKRPTSALGDSPGLLKSITMLLAIATANSRNGKERSQARQVLNELLDWAETYLPQYSRIRPGNNKELSELIANGPVGRMGVQEAYEATENKKYKTLRGRLNAFENKSQSIIFDSVADRNPVSKLKELESELDDIISEGWMNSRVLASLFETISGHMDDAFEEGISERTRKRMRPVFDGFANVMKAKYDKDYAEAFGMISLDSIQRKRRRANSRTRQETRDSSPVGSMAAGYSPTRLDTAEMNKDSHLTEEFKNRWVAIDESNQKADEILSSNNPSLVSFPGNDITFNWQNESSRLKYLTTSDKNRLIKNFIRKPNGASFPSRLRKTQELDSSGLLEEIGVYGETFEKHPFFVTFHGDKLVKFATSPSDVNADANTIKKILGAIHPELNPETFEAIYQSWIRNPFITIDTNDGKTVGVRFGLNNNDTEMRNELRKRIRDVYDFVSRITGGKVPKAQYPAEKESAATAEAEFPLTMRGLANDFFRRIQPSLLNRGHSIESLSNIFNQNAEEMALPEIANREQLLKFLQENFPGIIKNLKPESSKLDGLTSDEVTEAVEIVSMLNDGTRVLNFGEIKQLLSTKENGYELWTDDAVEEVINTVNNYTSVSGGSQLIETGPVGRMSLPGEKPSEILRDEFEAARILRSMQKAKDMTPEEEDAYRKVQWARQELENVVEEDWVRFGPFDLTNAYRPLAERQSGNLSLYIRSLGDEAAMDMFKEISSKFPDTEKEESISDFESKIRTALSKAARGDEITPNYPDSWPPEMLDSDLNEILSPKEMAAVAQVEDALDRETLVSMLGGELLGSDPEETRQEILRIVESLPKINVPEEDGSSSSIKTPEQMSQDILIEAFDGTLASAKELVDSMSEQQLDSLRKSFPISDYAKNSFNIQNLQVQRASLIRQTSVAMAKLSQTEDGRNKIRQHLTEVADLLPDGTNELLRKIQNSEIEEEDAYESLSRYVGDSESTQPVSKLWFNTAAPLFSANNETSDLLKVFENDKKNQINKLFAEIAFAEINFSEESPEKIKKQIQEFVQTNPVDGIGSRGIYIEPTTAGKTQSALEKKQLELISKYDGTSESAKEIIDSLTEEQVRKLWAKYIFPSFYRVTGTGPGSFIRKRNQKASAERAQQVLNRLEDKFKNSIYGLGGFVDADGYSADDVNMLISDAIENSFGVASLESLSKEEKKEYVSLVGYFLSGGRSLLVKGEYTEALRKIDLEKTPKSIQQRKLERIDNELSEILNDAGDKMDEAVSDLLGEYRNMSPEELEILRKLEEEFGDTKDESTSQGGEFADAPDDWEDNDPFGPVGSMARKPDGLTEKAEALLDANLTPHKKHDQKAQDEFAYVEQAAALELRKLGLETPGGFFYTDSIDDGIDPRIEASYVAEINKRVDELFENSEFRRMKSGKLVYIPQRLIGGESASAEDELIPYNPEMDEDESLRPSNFNPDRHPIASALNERYESFIGGNNNHFTRDWFGENGRYGTDAQNLLGLINNEPGLIDMDKILTYVQNQSGWIEGEDLEESMRAAESISIPIVPERYRSGGSRFGISSFSSQRRLSATEKIELDKQKKIARSKAKSSKALRDGWLNDMTTGLMLSESEIGLRDGYYPDAVLAGIKSALRENGQIDNLDSVIRAAKNASDSRSQAESRVKALARVIEITQNSGDLISEIYDIDNAINELDDAADRTSRQYQERIRSQILSRVSATASLIKAREMFIADQKEKIRSRTIAPRDYLISIQEWDSRYGPQILQMQAEIQSFSTKAEASSRTRYDIMVQKDELQKRAAELKDMVADSARYMNVLMAQRAVNEAMKNLADNNGDGVAGSGPVGSMKKIGRLFGESGVVSGFDENVDDTSNVYTPFNISMTKKEKALSNVILSQLRSVNGIQTIDLVENRTARARQRIESYRQSVQSSPVGAVRGLSNEIQDIPEVLKSVLQDEYNRSIGKMLAFENENDIRSLVNASYTPQLTPNPIGPYVIRPYDDPSVTLEPESSGYFGYEEMLPPTDKRLRIYYDALRKEVERVGGFVINPGGKSTNDEGNNHKWVQGMPVYHQANVDAVPSIIKNGLNSRDAMRIDGSQSPIDKTKKVPSGKIWLASTPAIWDEQAPRQFDGIVTMRIMPDADMISTLNRHYAKKEKNWDGLSRSPDYSTIELSDANISPKTIEILNEQGEWIPLLKAYFTTSPGMPSRTSQILNEIDGGADIYSLARKNNMPITEIFSIAAIRESLLANVKHDIQKLTLRQLINKYGFSQTRLINAIDASKKANKFRKSYSQMMKRFNELAPTNTLASSYEILNEEFPEITKIRGMGSAAKLITLNDELLDSVREKISRAMRLFSDYPNMVPRVAAGLTGISQDSAKSIYKALLNDENRTPRPVPTAIRASSPMPADWDYMTYGERQDWLSSDEAKQRMGARARGFAAQRNAEDIESSGSMDGPYGAIASALKKANLDKDIYGTNSSDENGVSPTFSWRGLKDSDLIRTGFLSTSKFIESIPNLQTLNDENFAVFLNTSPAIAQKLRSGKFNLSFNAARKLAYSIGKNPENIWPTYAASEQKNGPDGDLLWISGNWSEMKPVFESIESGQNDSEISGALGRAINPKMATARKLATNGKLEDFYKQVGKKNPSIDEVSKFMSSLMPESRRETVASFAKAGYSESEIVETTGFNPNTVRNLLHELRKSGMAPSSIGSQEWIAKNRKAIVDDIESGMSKRQAMRKYGIGAAALNSVIQPKEENARPRQSFRNAYEEMASGPSGAMSNRRIASDASQSNGPTPEWDSENPEVGVFLPDSPPVMVGSPFHGPIEARRFSDGEPKDQEALDKWFPGLVDLLKYHVNGGELFDSSVESEEDAPSVYAESEKDRTKPVNEMIRANQFPGLIRSMRHMMGESYKQMVAEQQAIEEFGPDGYSERGDSALEREYQPGFIDVESITSLDSPIAKEIMMIYRSLGRVTSGFVPGDSSWINDAVRLMSRDSELEKIGLNEDSRNKIKEWMRTATAREFKAAQAMSAIHSMMIDVVNDVNSAMFPNNQFTGRTVADDQMLGWYFDRIFKAIYDEADSSFVLEDISREKGDSFVRLNPEQIERWYDSTKDIGETMAALFADAIEFSSTNSKFSDDSFNMLSVAPRKAADGKFSIYGPDIVYSGMEDSRPYNKAVKWFARPGTEEEVESLYDSYEKSPDAYWWQGEDGQISTTEPITTKDILSMDSGGEFSEYMRILTESIAESPDENASVILRQLFGITPSGGTSLNKDELALNQAYSQLSGFLRGEVDSLKENRTRVSENMTMSSYFPWVNWSNSSDAYPVISGDIQSLLTPEQAERYEKINTFTQERIDSLDGAAKAAYQKYVELAKNTSAINNLRKTRGRLDESLKPLDKVFEEIKKLQENPENASETVGLLAELQQFAEEIGAQQIADTIDGIAMKIFEALQGNATDYNPNFKDAKTLMLNLVQNEFAQYLKFFDSAMSVGDAFEKIAQFIKAEDKKTRRNSLMPRYKREVIDAAPASTFSTDFKNIRTFDSWLNDNGYEDLTYEYYSSADEIPKNFFGESSEINDDRIVPPGDGPIGKMALNRYTKPNIMSVVHAHEEAKLGKSSEVTIPYLLLGLARENIGKKSVNQSIAGRVLNRLGISVNDLRDAISKTLTPSTSDDSGKVASLSFSARKTMINSVREALNRGENIIDTEHLIASIARAKDGRDDGLSEILKSLGTSKSELLAESVSTMKRFSMGRFPNESGPIGKMGIARDATLQRDREIEALRADENASNLWFNKDRNPGIRNNTASDSEQVQELQRLMDLYVSGVADKSISANDFREGTSPFSSDSILPTNSSLIYGEIGEEPSDIIGAIAYRSNLIDAMIDRSGKDYKDYTDIIAKAKSLFNNDKHIELFNDDSPTGRMSTFDGLIKSYEGIYGMPTMQPQDEYYESVYGTRDIASDSLRRAAYTVSKYSPLDISKNLTSGDDDDVEWSTNNWSLAKNRLMQASDAVIVRMNNNDLRSAEVLMIDRKSGPFTNAKALVGGLRDGSEDYMTTATREGLEEVGIDLESSIEARPLGIITSPDWDPRFVKGARVGAGLFIVPWDSNVTAASDAKAASWVPLEDIARGKYPIAFGHAEWLRRAVAKMGKDYEGSNSADPFSDLRLSIALRLNILAKAQRIRNQRILARINKVRSEKDAEKFLPNDKMPHPLMPWGAEFKSDSWNPDGPVGKMARPSRPIVDKSLAQDLGLLDYQSGYSIDELNSSSPIPTSQKYRLSGNKVSDDRYNGLWIPYMENSISRVSKPEFNEGKEQPTVYVLGGSSGTGKTIARTSGFSGIPSYNDAVVIDPDDAKMVMPEARYWYERQLPDAANLTHAESRALAASLMRRASSEGIDMTYDTSGQFNDGNKDLINWRKAGYKIVAHYFFSPDDVILKRNAERFERTGRMVPDWIPPVINRNLYFQLPNLDAFFDELFVYDTTNDPMNPIMVARRAINEQLEVMDPKLFDFANFDKGR